MASVLQTLFHLPAFQQRYYPSAAQHWATCREALPASCVDCQMHKLADGLLSGRYAHPRPGGPSAPQAQTTAPVFQEGVRPAGFKALVGRGHEEFATMRQQDAEEFFGHLLTVLRRHAKRAGDAVAQGEPTEVFAFGMEQRLECGECRRVRYRVDAADVASVPVPVREKGKDAEGRTTYGEVELQECLDVLTAPEALEYSCPACRKNVIATR